MAAFNFADPNSRYSSIAGFGMQVPPAVAQIPQTPVYSFTSPEGITPNNLNFAAQVPAPAATNGLGLNIPSLQLGLGGIQGLANLYNSFAANRLARDQFQFTKDVTNTNLNNSISSYNTALEDRARARGVAEGQTGDQVSDYIARNRLSR